jgi:hypothetical protein
VPTLTDNLFADGQLDANVVSVSFNPTRSLEIQNGELTWGL